MWLIDHESRVAAAITFSDLEGFKHGDGSAGSQLREASCSCNSGETSADNNKIIRRGEITSLRKLVLPVVGKIEPTRITNWRWKAFDLLHFWRPT